MAQAVERLRAQQRAGSSRVPPHNLQAEESLLGAMLLSRDAIVAAVEAQLSASDFYKPAHGHVFEAITSLYAHGEPADPVTVSEELRRAGLLEAVGGSATLISLQAGTPAISNAARYAGIVEENSLLRRLIAVAGDIAEMGYAMPDDVSAAVDEAEALIFDVAQRRVTDSLAPIRDLLNRHLDHIEALFERGHDITGIPTGFIDLDHQLAGLQPSNLVIVGGRPGTGKTSWALGVAAHAAVEARKPVLVFSLEMSHLELTQRLLCSEARVDAVRMRNGRLLESDWPKISQAVERLAEAPLFIDDNPHLTVMEIRAKARRLKSREGIGLIVIDYLQLMTGRQNAENRQVEVSEISRGLKILARELEVPVIALSQLSRGLETRSDKRPVLADLRESGCLTADARVTRADTGAEVTMGELFVKGECDFPIWSVDGSGRMVAATMRRAFSTGVKPVFEMRMASGRRLKATANHPFLTSHGWRALEQLGIGSRVAAAPLVPEPLAPEARTEAEVQLLAHLLGAGGMAAREPVHYASAQLSDVETVERAARQFGVDPRRSWSGNAWRVDVTADHELGPGSYGPVGEWLGTLGLHGVGNTEKFLPATVHALPNRQLADFLRHFWHACGRARLDRRQGKVYFGAPSRYLLEGVQGLLLRFGVVGRIQQVVKESGPTRYHLYVDGADNQVRFIHEIGLSDSRRHLVPAVVARLAAANANAPTAASSGGSPALLVAERRTTASAAGDVGWDTVVSITPMGHEPVFDAQVDPTHSFLANGLVSSNSLEQDADVVIFIYRDEVYNRDSPDRGTAEIIVAKHRNGPTGVTQLAFLDHYTRFANMAKGV